MSDLQYPHLFVPTQPEPRAYRNPIGGGREFELPDRPNRRSHADMVRRGIEQAWIESAEQSDARKAVSLPTKQGTYIEFESAPGFELKFDSLEARKSNIRLLNVRSEIDASGNEIQKATLYVPHGKKKILADKVTRYRNEDTPKGNPKNKALIESIQNLQLAVLHSFWNDRVDLIPTETEKVWCEVWLRVETSENNNEVVREFRALCNGLEILAREGVILFPERIVALIEANSGDLSELMSASERVAEFRRAKETADFWTGIANSDQAEWAQGLADRISIDPLSNVAACVLDTGANNGHPLLNSILSDENCDSVDAEWGDADEDGHGTNMCGTVGYGDNLSHWLQSDEEIELPYFLESIKLIPRSGYAESQDLNGLRTSQAISRAELLNSAAARAICMAVTSVDGRDRGRPSSWSGAVDAISSGASDDTKRLIIVSAGNVSDPQEWSNYPDSNITSAIHDPGQSWNALTVGAITLKDIISNNDLAETYSPIARAGELSPYSTTSKTWQSKWPNKPDIVMEGGNLAIDATNFSTELDDLSVLSLNYRPQDAVFTSNYATSASTALATELAARLFAQYPNAWPETVRGLIVHSAQWTNQLRDQFSDPHLSEKQKVENLLRICGYGYPDFRRATESASNSLTMIVEREIKPFRQSSGPSDYKANEMQFYRLPWPTEALAELPGETPIKIDVTLSYFVEPGPGEIGWRDKYRYRSHGLDFNLIKPSETLDEFIARLNKAERDDDGDYGGSSIPWEIGPQMGRTRGSIHRDWVTLTAAEAVEANIVGVFPRSGWWKERAYLGSGDKRARYSLIVSINTPETDVDIYTPVSLAIAPTIPVET